MNKLDISFGHDRPRKSAPPVHPMKSSNMADREVVEAFDKAVASYRAFVTGEESSHGKRRQPVTPPPQRQDETVVVVGTVVGVWDAATGNAVFI